MLNTGGWLSALGTGIWAIVGRKASDDAKLIKVDDAEKKLLNIENRMPDLNTKMTQAESKLGDIAARIGKLPDARVTQAETKLTDIEGRISKLPNQADINQKFSALKTGLIELVKALKNSGKLGKKAARERESHLVNILESTFV